MSTHTLKSWWQNRREAARCSKLQEELRLMLYGATGNEEAQIQKLVNCEKYRHPGKSESWYLDKIIYSLRRFAA
ncbi:MAG: hypothetical protein Tsb0014_32560 [Pleurocapsa sp.]